MRPVDTSFFAAPDVKVYLPDGDGQWPAVFHTLSGTEYSSRVGRNQEIDGGGSSSSGNVRSSTRRG